MKLSIITINYNNLEGLKKTVESVISQSYTEFEYIVIDGGSTDGSKEFLETKQQQISYWISEKDSGIYNAMNKGVKVSNGEYLVFLNSGDHFNDNDSLTNAVAHLDTTDLISFDTKMIHDNGSFIYSTPSKLDFAHMYYKSIPHPSTFIKRDLFTKVGVYDESLKIVSDWKFFLMAICQYNCTVKTVSETIAVQYAGGVSSLPQNQHKVLAERTQVLKENFPSFVENYEEYFRLKTLEHSKPIKVLRFFGLLKNYFDAK